MGGMGSGASFPASCWFCLLCWLPGGWKNARAQVVAVARVHQISGHAGPFTASKLRAGWCGASKRGSASMKG